MLSERDKCSKLSRQLPNVKKKKKHINYGGKRFSRILPLRIYTRSLLDESAIKVQFEEGSEKSF